MIARKSVLILFSRWFSSFWAFIGLYFVAHIMGPEALGMIGYGLGILGMFSFILYMGFEPAHIKRVSEGQDLGKCIGTYVAIRLASSFLFFLIVVSSIIILEKVWYHAFSYEQKIVIYILMFVMVIESLNRIALSTFTAQTKIAKQQSPAIVRGLVQPLIKILIVLRGFGVIALAGANLLGALIAGLIAIVMFRKYPISKPDYGYFKSYLKFALPSMFLIFFLKISESIDTVMIGAFFSVVEVGYYYTIGQIYNVIQTMSAAVAMLLFPTMSKAHAKNDFGRIFQLAQKSERFLAMIFIPIISVFIVFADPLIYFLLGTEFLLAAPLLRIMGITILLISINRPYITIIPAINRPGISAIISSIGVTLSILLNVVLIPRELFGITLFGLGALGAAIGTLVTVSVTVSIVRIYLYRSLGFKPYNARILLHLFAGIVMLTFLQYLGEIVPIYNFPYFIGSVLLGIGLYFVLLTFLGEIKKKDVAFFIETLSPKKMAVYIADEIKR